MTDKSEWRALLDQLVEFLNRRDQDAQKLWWVLSSLRGPDDISTPGDVKYATTSVLRYEIGLRGGAGNGIIVNEDDENFAKLRQTRYNSQENNRFFEEHHFLLHVREAFDALGLEWNKKNGGITNEKSQKSNLEDDAGKQKS